MQDLLWYCCFYKLSSNTNKTRCHCLTLEKDEKQYSIIVILSYVLAGGWYNIMDYGQSSTICKQKNPDLQLNRWSRKCSTGMYKTLPITEAGSRDCTDESIKGRGQSAICWAIVYTLNLDGLWGPISLRPLDSNSRGGLSFCQRLNNMANHTPSQPR